MFIVKFKTLNCLRRERNFNIVDYVLSWDTVSFFTLFFLILYFNFSKSSNRGADMINFKILKSSEIIEIREKNNIFLY